MAENAIFCAGSEYQIYFKNYFRFFFETWNERYRELHGFAIFSGAIWAAKAREWQRSTLGLWWQERRLPTTNRFTDITLRVRPGILPEQTVGSTDGSIFEQLPAKSP